MVAGIKFPNHTLNFS